MFSQALEPYPSQMNNEKNMEYQLQLALEMATRLCPKGGRAKRLSIRLAHWKIKRSNMRTIVGLKERLLRSLKLNSHAK